MKTARFRPTKVFSMRRALAASAGALLGILLIWWLIQRFFPQVLEPASPPTGEDNRSQSLVEMFKAGLETSGPYAELTIPHLRNRAYESQLGELDQVGNNGTFTTFLTSYESDGLKVNGLLTQPTGEIPAGGWPAVVFIHGYIPPTQYRTQEKYADYVNYLARNGLVVFKIDLRGHGSSEGEASGAYYSGDYIIDTLNARAALQTSGFVNPERVGLWGHSMAGNVVLRSLAVRPEIRAAVIWAGAVYSYEDWQAYRLNDGSYRPPSTISDRQRRRQNLFDTHGEFSPTSEFWQTVAATNYVNDLTGAIQFHHAVNDGVVNIGYSRDLNALLDQTAVPHELHEYSTGGHNLEGSAFGQAMQRTVEWFREYL
jgi:dipeptidyl aminopeptidase/acylaminoacyl peptidase